MTDREQGEVTPEVITRLGSEVNFYSFQWAIRTAIAQMQQDVPGLAGLVFCFDNLNDEEPAWMVEAFLCGNCDKMHFRVHDVRTDEIWIFPTDMANAIASDDLDSLVVSTLIEFIGRANRN